MPYDSPDIRLIKATDTCNVEEAKLAINDGANINNSNINYHNYGPPIVNASMHDCYEIVKLLLLHHANIDNRNKYGCTALYFAAGNNSKLLVKLLIENDANVSIPGHIEGYPGMPPLLEAAVAGYTEICELLLNAGADVNSVGYENMTALMRATSNGHLDTIKVLLQHNADINCIMRNGSTALDIARQYKQKEAEKLLINYINHKDSNGI